MPMALPMRLWKPRRELREAQVSYSKADGIHVQAYKAALAHFGISKAAYFGHAYIGKYCKLLCTQRIARAISELLASSGTSATSLGEED